MERFKVPAASIAVIQDYEIHWAKAYGLAASKAGRRRTLKGRFAHIRYFALRDEDGAYLGTLEVTQDLTRERSAGRSETFVAAGSR